MQSSGILSVGCIRDTRQSHISRMIEYNVRSGTGDQHIGTNVKLTAVQQKRVHHVSATNKNSLFSLVLSTLECKILSASRFCVVAAEFRELIIIYLSRGTSGGALRGRVFLFVSSAKQHPEKR